MDQIDYDERMFLIKIAVTEDNLVDDTLAFVVISEGDFMQFCSVLFSIT